MDIKILIASHKACVLPEIDIYFPIQVGAKGKKSLGYLRDDQGKNISNLNPYFCELTGIYWAWKNLKADYIGLVHYRRFLKGRHKGKRPIDCILNRSEAEELLKKTDIILPKKRNYYIETVYSHYAHTHYAKDLNTTRDILKDLFPEYVPAFDKQMRRTTAHMFNMFIMKNSSFDSYCNFLFPVLFELQKRIDISEYNPFQARVFGRISELLLDVWIETNQLDYKEVPFIYLEKINWFRKGKAFLSAKLFNKKYEGSF